MRTERKFARLCQRPVHTPRWMRDDSVTMAFASARATSPPARRPRPQRAHRRSPTARARRSTSPAYDTATHRAARRGAARPGAARGVVRARAASRRRSSAASSCGADGDAARRGAHARRRAPARAVRRALGRRARLRARARAASRGSPRATSCRAEPRGDLLQAGPLLVRDGAPVFRRERRRRGLPRRRAPVRLRHHRRPLPARRARARPRPDLAVACDGRSRHDAGLTLEELAALMAALGCDRRR